MDVVMASGMDAPANARVLRFAKGWSDKRMGKWALLWFLQADLTGANGKGAGADPGSSSRRGSRRSS